MSDWFELHDAHRALRATGGSSLNDIRRVLRRLIERGHAESSLFNRFTYSKNPDTGLREWRIAAPPGKDKKDWSEPLKKLAPNLAEASLTVLALTDSSNERLGQLTIMLEGRSVTRKPFSRSVTRKPFIVAAHLDDRPMGSGACGHALFHCHVGPSFKATPEVRVPLPALKPAAALEWALSVVLPDWEPVPWHKVIAHANGQGT
ncbi:MAG TPA: hypothetical protein VEU33_08415 [Archangium sp.]|nr:hypothetical protein [Archangium sp.]